MLIIKTIWLHTLNDFWPWVFMLLRHCHYKNTLKVVGMVTADFTLTIDLMISHFCLFLNTNILCGQDAVKKSWCMSLCGPQPMTPCSSILWPVKAQGSGFSLALMNHTASPSNLLVPGGPWYPCRLIPMPPSLLSPPLIYPLLPTTSLILLFSSPQGLVGLASTQSPSISSTSDIIRTEKSWEHSFPMILKWHHRHSGQAGWLVGQLAGWMTGWLAGPEKGELKCITYPD